MENTSALLTGTLFSHSFRCIRWPDTSSRHVWWKKRGKRGCARVERARVAHGDFPHESRSGGVHFGTFSQVSAVLLHRESLQHREGIRCASPSRLEIWRETRCGARARRSKRPMRRGASCSPSTLGTRNDRHAFFFLDCYAISIVASRPRHSANRRRPSTSCTRCATRTPQSRATFSPTFPLCIPHPFPHKTKRAICLLPLHHHRERHGRREGTALPAH